MGSKPISSPPAEKPADQLLREMADREAIRDLPIRYSDCLCRSDIDGVVRLFTKDGTFTAKNEEQEVVSRGTADLKKMYKNMFKNLYPRPFAHTHLVELQGADRATGRCYVEMRSAKINLEWIGTGYYEDEYAKVGGEWKFASRRLTEVGTGIPLRNFMAG